MKHASHTHRADWISKTLAGLILGFFIAMAISGLFFLLPLSIGRSAEAQLMMWLFAPIWLTLLSTCYLFRNGKQAWLWLTVASITLYTLYFLLTSL